MPVGLLMAVPGESMSWGLGGWDGSTTLATAVGQGVLGNAGTGVSFVACFRLNMLPAGGSEFLSTSQAGNNGWTLSSASGGIGLRGAVGTGAAQVFSPARAWVAGDVGKLHLACVSSNAASVFCYFDKTSLGSTAAAGYGVPGDRTYWSTSAIPQPSFTMLGICGRNSHLTLADFNTICDASKAAGGLALGAIPMDHQWNAPQTDVIPATIPDIIGAHNMTFTLGSPANLTSDRVARQWGF